METIINLVNCVFINSNNQVEKTKTQWGKSYRNLRHKFTHLSKIQEGTKEFSRFLLTSPETFPSKSMTDPPSSSHYNSGQIYNDNYNSQQQNSSIEL
jgi:hypothetical protein